MGGGGVPVETKESFSLAVRVAIGESARGNCSIRNTSHVMELRYRKDNVSKMPTLTYSSHSGWFVTNLH